MCGNIASTLLKNAYIAFYEFLARLMFVIVFSEEMYSYACVIPSLIVVVK